MIHYIDSIHDAMLNAGITPPPEIYFDGTIHRFDIDRPSDKAGWYCFYDNNIPTGSFGNWKTGVSENWCSRSKLSPVEREQRNRAIENARKQRAHQKQADYKKAAKKAVSIWQSIPGAPADHLYLKKKDIQPHGVKVYKGSLVIPVCVNNEITSLQFINSDGGKKFLSGGQVKAGYYLIGTAEKQIFICEGFATGATIYEETGQAVFCAFNAKNLTPVAKYVRAKYSGTDIIIAGDNDHHTDGNPGVTEANRAAQAVDGSWVVPVFTGLNASPKDTDFNDLKKLTGGCHV